MWISSCDRRRAKWTVPSYDGPFRFRHWIGSVLP